MVLHSESNVEIPSFISWFCSSVCFETGYPHTAQASTCLYFLSAGIIGMCHHGWLHCMVSCNNSSLVVLSEMGLGMKLLILLYSKTYEERRKRTCFPHSPASIGWQWLTWAISLRAPFRASHPWGCQVRLFTMISQVSYFETCGSFYLGWR
jgi:hypothetical protein